MNGKAVLPRLLAALLCVTVCIPVFASAENRILLRASDTDGAGIQWIETVCETDDGFSIVCQAEGRTRILRYTDAGSEPEVFLLEEEEEEEYVPGAYAADEAEADESADDDTDEDEEDSGFLTMSGTAPADSGGETNEMPDATASYAIDGWFSQNNEIYALKIKELYNETDSRVDSVTVLHAKTENGKVTLEDAGLPELDTGYLTEEAGQSSWYTGMRRLFAAGDRLVGLTQGGQPKVLVFDLTDGSCRDTDAGMFADIAPGPEGSVLICRCEEKGDGVTARVSCLDPAEGQEEELAVITGLKQIPCCPCYDAEKDILYYVSDGRLWKMPRTAPEKAEAVCEFSETESSAILLADGSILLWNNRSAAVRDTEPERSGRITLRVSDSTGNSALNEAVYEMGTLRGNVSVSLEQGGRKPNDILNALLVRDGSTDIYVLFYDDSDFKAARDRGYLADLGKNSSLAAYTERMYSFARDAMKRDGKTVGIPLGVTGDAVSINLRAWKKLGGTEEELPRTWDQFLDWLGMLPDRLAGTGIAVTSGFAGRQEVRAGLIGILTEMYQIRMERTGKDYLFNTPELRDLLQRICDLDYRALGIPEQADESQYEIREALLDFGNGISGVRDCGESTPLALAFAEGEEPFVPVSLFAAFMNPYSDHPEEAGELLSLILKNLDQDAQYSLFGDLTEPVREPLAGDPADWTARLEMLRKLQETAEGDDKVLLEEEIRQAEQDLEKAERDQWRISPEDIGQYQKSQAAFRVMDSFFIRDLMGTGGDQEAMEAFRLLFYGDEHGVISPEKALELIDKKLRMKRMEGN